MMLEFSAGSRRPPRFEPLCGQLCAKNYVTPDLGGDKRTVEVGDWLAVKCIEALAKQR